MGAASGTVLTVFRQRTYMVLVVPVNVWQFVSLSCSFLAGGGTAHMKGVGMLVVSLRDVNFGFWSHLGCSRQNAIIFSREGLV